MPKLECWLVVKGTSSPFATTHSPNTPYAGQRKVDRVRATKIAVNKPTLSEDEITFRIEMDIDESWFLDGIATIQASVPQAPRAAAVVNAQVDMPVRGRPKSPAAGVLP